MGVVNLCLPDLTFLPGSRPSIGERLDSVGTPYLREKLAGKLPSFVPLRYDASESRLSQSSDMDAYNFPDYRLKKTMDDPTKTPLLLVACGSFSPITFLHLRMFIMAADYVRFSTDFEIVGGYLSPVSDAYKKAGLASAEHR